jgi:hypothetical protein
MSLSKLQKSLVPGTKLTVSWSWKKGEENRTVHSCNSYQLVVLKDDDQKSYLRWPAASQVIIHEDGFDIMDDCEPDEVGVRYKFVKP